MPGFGDLLRTYVVPSDPANGPELARARIPRMAFYLLRPDGHIGLAGIHLDTEAVNRYVEGRLHLGVLANQARHSWNRYASQRLTARVTLCPPKPNELESATSTWRSTFRLGAESRSHLGSGVNWLMVGGIMPQVPTGGDGELERTGAAEQMAGHGLGRAEDELPRLVAEDRLDRLGLGDVPLGRRGAVGVDVSDVLEIDLAVLEAAAHGAPGAVAVLGRAVM